MRTTWISATLLALAACSPAPNRPSALLPVGDAQFGSDAPDTGATWKPLEDVTEPSDADMIPDPGVATDPGLAFDPGMEVPDEGPPDTGPEIPDEGPDVPEVSQLGPITGGIAVLQVDNPQFLSAQVNVKFREGPAPLAPIQQTVGACSTMDVSVFTNGIADPSAGLDAGTVTITGLQQPMSLIPVDQGGTKGHVYSSGLPANNSSILSGSTITVAASGGQFVPAWETVIASPTPVNVSWPPDDLEEQINKKKDLAVTWTAGNGTHTRIDLVSIDGQDEDVNNGVMVVCELDGDPGSFVVPSALFSQLHGGGDASFPDFNFDYLVFGVTRVILQEVPVAGGGMVTVAVSRSNGGIAKLDK